MTRALAVFALVMSAAGCDCGPDSAGTSQRTEVKGPAADPAKEIAKGGSDVAPESLYVSPESYDFSRNPALLARILESPHGYFRFINREFAETVCTELTSIVSRMPRVNLHGDAHIEQYAVTDLGRGLTDFDDATTGPGLIDLLRLGVSLHLAAHQHGFHSDADELFDHFLEGYKAALRDPKLSVPEPAWAARVRAEFKYDTKAYLKWAESLMEPLDEETEILFAKAAADYSDGMLAESQGLPRTFYDVKRVGRLRMGIGSALDEKFLVRVEGPTLGDLDDVILEAKEVRDLAGISCVEGAKNIDPFRILVGQSRVAYEPYHHLGFVLGSDNTYWVHAWTQNYKELSVRNEISAEDLMAIVYDVGVQLGRGHTKQIAAPHDAQLRRLQLRVIERHERAIKKATDVMTRRTIVAWQRFKRAVEEGAVDEAVVKKALEKRAAPRDAAKKEEPKD